jgi:hypothetical protein
MISATSGKRPSRSFEKSTVSPSSTSNWLFLPETVVAARPVCSRISAARLAARSSYPPQTGQKWMRISLTARG